MDRCSPKTMERLAQGKVMDFRKVGALSHCGLLTLLLAAFLNPAAAQSTLSAARLAEIDAHALAADPHTERSPERLAAYLVSIAANDAEKSRAIFRWIADRIDYDVQAYLTDNLSVASAQDVLRSRSSICDGYATLFETLGKLAGLEVASIQGYAKAYGHENKPVFDKRNHAWNAVRIDGQWRLIDPTWGAGAVRDGQYVRQVREVYFLASPDQLAFTHLPEDERWQMQTMPRLSKGEFESLPRMEPAFFDLGISGEAVWKTLQEPSFDRHFVRTFDVPFGVVTVNQAPLHYRLASAVPYDFDIHSEDMEQMAFIQGNEWTYLQKAGTHYRTRFVPARTGELSVAGRKRGSERFTTFLVYHVD